jgi:uncharacterized protein
MLTFRPVTFCRLVSFHDLFTVYPSLFPSISLFTLVRQTWQTVSFEIANPQHVYSVEAQCVCDADRLDAIGAIGIARTFSFGSRTNARYLHPNTDLKSESEINDIIASRPDVDPKVYKRRDGSTIGHFYDKLFRLHNLMKTPSGNREAGERTQLMKTFVTHFLNEAQGLTAQ